MITIEKIKIYDRYRYEGDRPIINARRERELKLFEGDEWAVIGRFYADMPMINNDLADHAYSTRVIKELYEQCEPDAFRLLAGQLIFYKHFQGVIDILQQVKSHTHDNADTIWAGYDNAAEFFIDLEQDIAKLEYCDFATLEKVRVEFMATCTYQEMAMSNGWSDAYLKLGEAFDRLYKFITEGEPAETTPLPAAKPTWWKRLFGFK